FCSFTCFRFLTASAASACLTFLRSSIFRVERVEVDEFDETHFGVITQASIGQLDNAGIASRTVSDLRCHFPEKCLNRFFILQVSKCCPARVCCIVFRFRQKRLHILPQRLCFCYRGRNPL